MMCCGFSGRASKLGNNSVRWMIFQLLTGRLSPSEVLAILRGCHHGIIAGTVRYASHSFGSPGCWFEHCSNLMAVTVGISARPGVIQFASPPPESRTAPVLSGQCGPGGGRMVGTVGSVGC
eukprot:760128-Hanusia_phi.AAC.1